MPMQVVPERHQACAACLELRDGTRHQFGRGRRHLGARAAGQQEHQAKEA
jgi:hypothetical protein